MSCPTSSRVGTLSLVSLSSRLPPGRYEKWQSGQKKSATSVASAAKLKSWLRSSWSVNRVNRRSGSCSKSRSQFHNFLGKGGEDIRWIIKHQVNQIRYCLDVWRVQLINLELYRTLSLVMILVIRF